MKSTKGSLLSSGFTETAVSPTFHVLAVQYTLSTFFTSSEPPAVHSLIPHLSTMFEIYTFLFQRVCFQLSNSYFSLLWTCRSLFSIQRLLPHNPSYGNCSPPTGVGHELNTSWRILFMFYWKAASCVCVSSKEMKITIFLVWPSSFSCLKRVKKCAVGMLSSDHQNIDVGNNYYNLVWSSGWKREEDPSTSDLNTRKTGSDDEEEKMWRVSRKGKRKYREREKRVSWQELRNLLQNRENRHKVQSLLSCIVFIISWMSRDTCM